MARSSERRMFMFTFATDYFLLVFVSGLGVIQFAASLGSLRGLLFFKSAWSSRGVGAALIAGAFVWFFATGERNVNDFKGGLDANSQALFFFLGILAAGVVTFLATSIVNYRMRPDAGVPADTEGPGVPGGFDALADRSYARALSHSIGYWRRNWRRQIRHYFFG